MCQTSITTSRRLWAVFSQSGSGHQEDKGCRLQRDHFRSHFVSPQRILAEVSMLLSGKAILSFGRISAAIPRRDEQTYRVVPFSQQIEDITKQVATSTLAAPVLQGAGNSFSGTVQHDDLHIESSPEPITFSAS